MSVPSGFEAWRNTFRSKILEDYEEKKKQQSRELSTYESKQRATDNQSKNVSV